MPYSACVRCATCDGFPCLVHAKSDAEVLGGAPGARARQRHAAHQRPGRAAGDQRRPARRSPASSSTATASSETFTADIVVVSCGAANSAKLLLASASEAHPQRPGQRLRPGRAQLHVPQQPGRAGALQGAEPDGLPEDARAQRLLLRRRRLRLPAGQHPDGRQVVRREMYRGEKPLQTRLAPEWTLENVARHAVDFWLSTEDLPRPDNRVTLRDDGSIALALHGDQRGPQEAAAARAQVDARPPRHAPRPPDPAPRLPQERDPGRRRRPPGRHVPLRHRPGQLGARHRLPAHEVDNLYVVDTSFFPSIGAVNPALTAMANALRVGDHLLERMGCAAQPARSRPMSPDDRPHVVIVGGGFAGVGCARRLAEHDDVRVTLSTATTTTSSSRCSTRWRRRSSRRATSPTRCASCSATTRTSTSSSARSTSVDPATRTRHDDRRRAVRRRRARARGRVAAELLPHAGRGGARVPALLARRREAAALAHPRRLRGRRPRPGADRPGRAELRRRRRRPDRRRARRRARRPDPRDDDRRSTTTSRSRPRRCTSSTSATTLLGAVLRQRARLRREGARAQGRAAAPRRRR